MTDQPALTVAKVQNSRVGERKEDEQSRVAAGAGKKQDLSKEHAITQSMGRKVSFRVYHSKLAERERTWKETPGAMSDIHPQETSTD